MYGDCGKMAERNRIPVRDQNRTLMLLFTIIIVTGTLVAGCSTKVDPEDPVLARVGNQTLTLRTALEEIPELVLARDTLEAIRLYQMQWTEARILESEANRLGLNNHPDVRRRMERLHSQLLQNALKEAFFNRYEDELTVSVEEARNYYQANRERFVLEERYVRFRHLTTRTRAEANQARRDLLRGIPWEEVVEQYSVDPDRQFRESQRFLPISMAMPDLPAMRQFLEVIGRTEISPIREIAGFHHFVQLMEDRPEGTNPDLDWLIEQIRDWLYLEKAQRLYNSYKRNLYLQTEANQQLDLLEISSGDEALIRGLLQPQEP